MNDTSRVYSGFTTFAIRKKYLRGIMDPGRIIGKYTGEEHGTLLVVTAGLHGNEPAGITALEIMFQMLENEPLSNPNFQFRGRILGLRGNLKAIREGKRFLVKDLNRQWTKENIQRVQNSSPEELDPEDQELLELHQMIKEEISDYKATKVVILDLHTTTAHGGIFSIATDDPESTRIAVEMHAPVIQGMLKGISGTTLHYFNKENFDLDITCVAFESGQHQEDLSVNRAIAAITNCMRSVGCVRAEDVENRHDKLLIEYSKGLPLVAELLGAHQVNPGDNFRMFPDYKNFQAIKKGELLAKDKNGNIYAWEDALILMPLYQKQGDDGFFLIKKIEYY